MIPLLAPAGPLHLVCLAAHPDDVEIGCGGLLLSLARRTRVTGSWLTLTGTPDREVEARAAAEAFLPGAESSFARLVDGRLPGQWNQVKAALHSFADRAPSPDVVLAPRPDDAHQDHRLLGSMAAGVWRDALVLHYEIPKWDGDLGRATTYVPVSEADAARKAELLVKHYPSQAARDWWDRDVFLAVMRLRGVECRRRYAEGYTVTKSILDVTESAS